MYVIPKFESMLNGAKYKSQILQNKLLSSKLVARDSTGRSSRSGSSVLSGSGSSDFRSETLMSGLSRSGADTVLTSDSFSTRRRSSHSSRAGGRGGSSGGRVLTDVKLLHQLLAGSSNLSIARSVSENASLVVSELRGEIASSFDETAKNKRIRIYTNRSEERRLTPSWP